MERVLMIMKEFSPKIVQYDNSCDQIFLSHYRITLDSIK